jgi:hypothetical protein
MISLHSLRRYSKIPVIFGRGSNRRNSYNLTHTPIVDRSVNNKRRNSCGVWFACGAGGKMLSGKHHLTTEAPHVQEKKSALEICPER